MRFAGLLVSTCMIYSSVAVAGFEWLPPKQSKPKPSISQPIPAPAPTQQEKQVEKPPPQEKPKPSAEEVINRIFDYESGRINAHDMQKERDKRIERIVKIREEIKRKELEKEIQKRDKKLQEQKDKIEKLKKHADLLRVTPPPRHQVAKAITAPNDDKGLQAIPINPSDKPIIGFGTQMPLALTVNDIIPDEYSFSFGENVDPGMAVSWEGYHRPWTVVLAETLANAHLIAKVDNKKISILPDPSAPRVLPPMLRGSNFPARLSINPMPAPTSIDFSKKVTLSPFVSAKSVTADKPQSILMPAPRPATGNKRITINSFPLGKDLGQPKTVKPATTKIDAFPKMAPLTPSYMPQQAKQPVRINPAPKLQKPVATATHDEVYISRKESQRRAAQKESQFNFFNPLTAIKNLIQPSQETQDAPPVNIAVPPARGNR